jgi:glyoxylase-like metal-dependent hydrolase (beta-lactamase superfamily II)
MLIRSAEVGSFAANCYLLACDETREGVIIDPGAAARAILDMVAKEKVKVQYIINTHGHVDHVGANEEVRSALGVPLLIHEADGEMCKKPHASLSAFVGKLHLAVPDRLLTDGEKIKAGNLTIEVISTPGHTKGSISLLVDGALFTGDTLFAGSIGRTDFPGGSFEQIIRSIKERLLVFPDDTPVYPGHGPRTTIGEEKKYNPFLR